MSRAPTHSDCSLRNSPLAEPLDCLSTAKEHVARVALLHRLPIDDRLEVYVVGVWNQLRRCTDDTWSEG